MENKEKEIIRNVLKTIDIIKDYYEQDIDCEHFLYERDTLIETQLNIIKGLI